MHSERSEIDDRDAVFAQPIEAAGKVDGLADDHRADPELPHEAAAVPARGECRDHDRVAVGPLAAGLAECVRLAVDRRIALLDASIVPAAEQPTLPVEERRAYRDAALGEAEPRLFERDPKESRVVQPILRRRGSGCASAGSAYPSAASWPPW